MKFKEIETKYKADEISLQRFHDFCVGRKPDTYVMASGYDYFYVKKGEEGAFCRHRQGPDMNQLTFKRKTVDKNNFIRTELNIDLERTMTREHVSALCEEFGYDYNTALFKTCFVYNFEWYTLVYYICYNEEMKELGKFIEIELSEDKPWNNEEEAFGELVILEKLCKTLGLSAQGRVKRSLFELFRK